MTRDRRPRDNRHASPSSHCLDVRANANEVIGDFMMFFEKLALATFVGGLATAVAACSGDAKEDSPKAKPDAAAACAHINEVCASTEGFQTQDCSTSNAEYEKLSPTDKAIADSIAPCVVASTSCQSALNCLRPAADDSSSRAKQKPAPKYEAEEACEHINDVCEKEQGFENQDCSESNAAYSSLSDSDKELADGIAVCIMSAKRCKNAFKCLDFN